MLTALAFLLLPAKVDTAVVFSQVGDRKLAMDIYHPETATREPASAVVVIHGGAWIGGSRADMAPLCARMAKQGLLAVTVDYRLAPNTRWPGFYDDVQTAVRYLRANARRLNLNPKRIGACGASAGGHLALLLGTTDTRDLKATEHSQYSSRVQAVFDIFGPTDMSRDYPKSYDMLFAAVLGKPREQAKEEVRAASPVTYLDKKTSPIFILHGTADPVVPVAQSRWLESKLKALGTVVQSRYIDGMKHELPPSNPKVMAALDEGILWLKTTLANLPR